MSVKSPIYVLGFPSQAEADIRVQLGRILPDTPIVSYEANCVHERISSHSDWLPEDDAIVLLWDSMTVLSEVRGVFEKQPQANVIVLAEHGDCVRAEALMDLGVTDYRILPCPDEAMGIYVRKAEHQAELTRQAETQRQGSDIFITQDIETRRLLDQVALVAPSQASVLIGGESGTGKERLSRYIHQCSNRRDGAFVAINCAAIPEGMLESELFGHEKGAFTGATHARPGKFEMAHEGTLLLDEITEMPLHLQAKLLRVLQEGEVDRLGGKKPIQVDVRIIATSNRDIAQTVAEGNFRQDLYYRLNVVMIQLPPLRQRPKDVLVLAKHFLEKFSEMYHKPVPNLHADAVAMLQKHPWEGNVRELENCMHRAFLMSVGTDIQVQHLGFAPTAQTKSAVLSNDMQAGMSIRDMERVLIEKTLKHVQGNRTEAAKLLGISIRTLRNKLKDYQTGMEFAEIA